MSPDKIGSMGGSQLRNRPEPGVVVLNVSRRKFQTRCFVGKQRAS